MAGGTARSRGAASPGAACLLLVVAALALATRPAVGSLMSIDLGSEQLKVCLVKPGKTPIAVVVNEMSRRKSPALVGLVDGERVLGEEAYSMGIRFPTTVYAQLRNLAGRSASDSEARRLVAENLLPYADALEDDPATGTAALRVNSSTTYLVEELLAGIFQYARQITSAQAGENVVDAVITVPAWFGVAQRVALIDAASLAGLNVLGLMNTHAAAALQYGIERDFSKKEQLVLLYDQGSGSTEAALVRYSTYAPKGSASAKAVTNQFEVLDVEWDHSLGSNALDMLLLEHFAAEFQAKGGADIRSSPKAMAKLRRQVRRTKEVLSANSAAPISVEELHGGADFASHITRDAFEALAGAFWQRAAAPLVALLARNQLEPGDVDAVELLGGGSRVPKLQAVLSEALGGRHLDRHLDADEAVVLGAGLFAANLSSSFRLRKFGMTDIASFGISFESDDLFVPKTAEAPLPPGKEAGAKGKKGKAKAAAVPEEPAGDAASARPGHVLKNLLPAGKKLPIKRAIKYANLTVDGFSFGLAYNASSLHGLPPGVANASLAAYTVSGIQDAIKRYNHSGVTALRFEADYSSLLHFNGAECQIELEVLVNKTIEVPVNETEPAASAPDAAAAGAKPAEPVAADAQAGADAAQAEAEAGAGAEGQASKGEAEAGAGAEGQASKGEAEAAGKEGDMAASKDESEQATDKADAAGGKGDGAANATQPSAPKFVTKLIQVPRKRVLHVTLNVSGPGLARPPLAGKTLEAARAHIEAWQAAEAAKAATAKAKNDLEAYIIATRDRLETDDSLQQVTTEAARGSFQEALTEAEDWLYGDGEELGAGAFRDKLAALRAVGEPMARRAAELEARPQALAAVREHLAGARKLVASWPEDKPWIGEDEAAGVKDEVEGFSAWLKEQEAAQAEKGPTDEPAFAALDLLTKWEPVAKALRRLDAKRKPKPPKPAAKAAEGGGAEAEAGGAEAEAAAEAGEGAKAEAGAEAKAAGSGEQQPGQQQQEEEGSTADGGDDARPPVHEEL